MSKKLPVWDLTNIYKNINDGKIQKDIKSLIKKTKQLKTKKNEIKKYKFNDEYFLKYLKKFETIYSEIYKLYVYFLLQYDTNLGNEKIKSGFDNIKKLFISIEVQLNFFPQAIIRMPVKLRKKLCQNPKIAPYKNYLNKLAQFKKYTLSENEEKILSYCSLSGKQAWAQFYSEFRNTLNFGFLKVAGKKIKVDDNKLSSLLLSFDRQTREKANKKLKKTYGNKINIFSYIYNSLVNDYETENINLRGFNFGLKPKAMEEQIKTSDIYKMLEIIKKNQIIYKNYLDLKQKILKIKTFKSSDIYAPLYKTQEKINFSQAINDILNCLKNFDKNIANIAKKIINNNYIHARLSDKKIPGAYCCASVNNPFILINYEPDYRQVFTFAHELGHAIHQTMTIKKQPFLTRSTTKILSETASQFTELLLLDYYLPKIKNRKIKINILTRQLDGMLNAIFKQSLITQFEIQTHKKSLNQGLTKTFLNNTWYKLAKQLHGNKIILQNHEKYTWAAITHIFQFPFYCYTYSLSLFVVLALYKMYKNGNTSNFVTKYKELLSAGDSDNPKTLLKNTLNLNMDNDNFYNYGFEIINDLISKIQSL